MVRLVKASRKTHTIQAESWMPTADIQSWGIRPKAGTDGKLNIILNLKNTNK